MTEDFYYFPGTPLSIDEELAQIDLAILTLNFGKLRPEDEVLGEMTDFEKKAFIWNEMMAKLTLEKLLVSRHTKEESHKFEREVDIMERKSDELRVRVVKSLMERFAGHGGMDFRADGLVVRDDASYEESMLKYQADIEQSDKHMDLLLGEKLAKPVHN